MATADVLRPRDMNMPFNRTVAVSASRFVPRSTLSSGRRPTSCSNPKSSHRRRRGRSVDGNRRKETERETKELVMEKVRILKRGEKLCPNLNPNLVKGFDAVQKKYGVVMDVFSGNGFTTAPPASDLPMPKMNWLQKSEANVKIDVGEPVAMDLSGMSRLDRPLCNDE